jgi:exosortase/archaeosortase family protein
MKSVVHSIKWLFGASALAFALRFVLLFAVVETLAAAAVGSTALTPLVDSWDEMNATISDVVARWAGTPCTRYGTVLINGAFALDITPECSGLTATLLLVCAIVAFPSRWGFKVLGCACGTLLLFGVNILRIVTLVLVGGKRPELVEELHLNICPALIIAVAMVWMIAWIYLGTGRFGRFSHGAPHSRTGAGKVSDPA